MLVVGLTGGIGAGKSTFATLLVERGARVIDADGIGHAALQPGKPAWHSVVDQFGRSILSAGSMEIDRKRLADIVFGDPRKLAVLNAIVHPEIFGVIAETVDSLRATDAIVVVDAALIVETGLDKVMDVVVVVEASEDQRSHRLTRQRSMTPAEFDARRRAQTSPEELRARADIVVRNDGDKEDLGREADRVWAELKQRASNETRRQGSGE